jgi:putative FmdB family regulatory protein
MPIYEYRCQSCGHELEKLQRMNDAALTDCPACGKSALKRLISAAGFRLKGAGWYETDFKKSNQRNLVDSGSDKPAKSESGGSSSANSSGGDSKTSNAGSTVKADKPAKPSSPPATSS